MVPEVCQNLAYSLKVWVHHIRKCLIMGAEEIIVIAPHEVEEDHNIWYYSFCISDIISKPQCEWFQQGVSMDTKVKWMKGCWRTRYLDGIKVLLYRLFTVSKVKKYTFILESWWLPFNLMIRLRIISSGTFWHYVHPD